MAISIKRVERPRELKWFQAGAMLYGDWGTSKAYVLGIAFALAGHASWFYLGLMSLLTFLVGFCYRVVCRVYPDGGGVYSSLRGRSKSLATFGGLLLAADYVVTAALSALSAFHYFNVANPVIWAIGALVLVGLINWVGPTKGGSVAVVIGLLASATAGVLFLFTLPHIPEIHLTRPEGSLPQHWSIFVGIVLALSGVESVANMTGIMVEPVDKTARKAIGPVLLEVSLLTFLLGVAMNAVPNLQGHTDDMLRALGSYYVGPWFGEFVSIVFALLLLSAVNTAINSLISLQFLIAKDGEFPPAFARLNGYGMPWVALVVAVLAPIFVLLVVSDFILLAALYAIGVVGAITLNLAATSTNSRLQIRRWERVLLFGAALLLFFIEITIAYQKTGALIFATLVVTSGMLLKVLAKTIFRERVPEVVPSAEVLTVSEAKEIEALYRSSFLLALRQYNERTLDEAMVLARAKGEKSLYVCYVDEAPASGILPTEIAPSNRCLELFAEIEKTLQKNAFTMIPVWLLGDRPGHLIAYAGRALDVKTVVIGTTRRSALTNLVRGDVFRAMVKGLPSDCRVVVLG